MHADKNVKFVDLSKLPSKYRQQMADQMKARKQQQLDAAAAGSGAAGSEGLQGGEGSEAEEEEKIRAWQQAMLEQQAFEEEAELLAAAKARAAELRAQAEGAGPAGTSAAAEAEGAGAAAGTSAAPAAQQSSGPAQGANSSSSGPAGRTRLGLREVRDLVEAAQEQGLDPQQLLAEALALGGCHVSAFILGVAIFWYEKRVGACAYLVCTTYMHSYVGSRAMSAACHGPHTHPHALPWPMHAPTCTACAACTTPQAW